MRTRPDSTRRVGGELNSPVASSFDEGLHVMGVHASMLVCNANASRARLAAHPTYGNWREN
eukprot:7284355-Pyramimonas_sp.AAC.2